MSTDFARHQRRLNERDWTWDDMPFYDGPGTRPDILRFHQLDYLDVYERVYGRPIGANGVGRLREVGLVRITGSENQPWEGSSGAGLQQLGLCAVPDLDLFRREQEGYAEALEREHVAVHWIDPDQESGAAGGPPPAAWAAGDLLVVRGGAIVGRSGWNPLATGRAEWLSRWAFWNLNVPTLLTVSGHGVVDAGTAVWLAKDVIVVGLSIACDDDGLEQLLETVRLTAGVDRLEVLTIRCQGTRWFDRDIGSGAHANNLLAPLDASTVLCHYAGINTAALLWLRERGYRLVEADPDDQVRHFTCNTVLVEPGRVMMPAAAERTIERVRAAGVEVIEVPATSLAAAGGGLRSATMEIVRDQDPEGTGI